MWLWCRGNSPPLYPPNFPQSDLGRRADSRWALPQISSLVLLLLCVWCVCKFHLMTTTLCFQWVHLVSTFCSDDGAFAAAITINYCIPSKQRCDMCFAVSHWWQWYPVFSWQQVINGRHCIFSTSGVVGSPWPGTWTKVSTFSSLLPEDGTVAYCEENMATALGWHRGS